MRALRTGNSEGVKIWKRGVEMGRKMTDWQQTALIALDLCFNEWSEADKIYQERLAIWTTSTDRPIDSKCPHIEPEFFTFNAGDAEFCIPNNGGIIKKIGKSFETEPMVRSPSITYTRGSLGEFKAKLFKFIK